MPVSILLQLEILTNGVCAHLGKIQRFPLQGGRIESMRNLHGSVSFYSLVGGLALRLVTYHSLKEQKTLQIL